jgi:S-DNA-T family DNA segregation ATPase FtsK/SpoIIIE
VHTRLGGITIAPEAGRLVAVLGAGAVGSPAGGDVDDSAVRPDTAGNGALDAAAVSLALQHPLGDARFTFINLRPSADGDQREPPLVPLLRDLGFLVDVVERDMLIPTLRSIAETVTRQSSAVESHYIVAPGLDRAGSLTRVDESMSAPIDALRTILRDGPSVRVHLLAAWGSVRAYKAHVGYEDPVDGLLALRLDQRDVADLMGYTVEWQSPEHRGLLYDRTHAPRATTIVPAAALTEADRRMLVRVDWDK